MAGAAICLPLWGLNPFCLAPLRSAAKSRLTPLRGSQLAAPATALKQSKRYSRRDELLLDQLVQPARQGSRNDWPLRAFLHSARSEARERVPWRHSQQREVSERPSVFPYIASICPVCSYSFDDAQIFIQDMEDHLKTMWPDGSLPNNGSWGAIGFDFGWPDEEDDGPNRSRKKAYFAKSDPGKPVFFCRDESQ